MPAPENRFKTAIHAGRPQIGLWLDMGEAITAEIAGTAGFDWLVIDGEHGPNDLRSIIDQLRALATSPAEPVVRVPVGESWMIKRLLDAGARTLLVPMVDSAAQAEALVSAMHYPPRGIRGMGAAVARASAFNTITDYADSASDSVCLLVQAETRAAINDLDNILAVEGVDGIFIGPADLAADMGYLGRLDESEVQAVIEAAIVKIVAAGKSRRHSHLQRDLQSPLSRTRRIFRGCWRRCHGVCQYTACAFQPLQGRGSACAIQIRILSLSHRCWRSAFPAECLLRRKRDNRY